MTSHEPKEKPLHFEKTFKFFGSICPAISPRETTVPMSIEHPLQQTSRRAFLERAGLGFGSAAACLLNRDPLLAAPSHLETYGPKPPLNKLQGRPVSLATTASGESAGVAHAPKVCLQLKDVFGAPIRESATIQFHNLETSERKLLKGVDVSRIVAVSGLSGAPRGLYRMSIDIPSYMPVSRFLHVPASATQLTEIAIAIDPADVAGVKFPAYDHLPAALRRLIERSKAVLGFEGKSGKALYESLDAVRKAGMINIAVKANVTPLADDSTILARLEELHELRGDRFFVTVAKELREKVKHGAAAGLFHSVSGFSHHPPDGFTPAGSFKTPDNYGNLQLSFFMKGNECRADVDLDVAQGLGHIFQVLGNWLTNRPTHPYDIHQILYAYQHIDTGYRLEVSNASPQAKGPTARLALLH